MDTTNIDLSSVHRQILTALVNEYQDTESPVKSDRIADLVDRDAGTLKNQMVKLTSLNVVESVRGPYGGYKPTEKTYEVLDREQIADHETVTLAQDYERVDITVDEINFVNTHDPAHCRARIHFQERVEQLSVGDPIIVGPTPVHHLVVAGEVEAIFDTGDEVLVEVIRMEGPMQEE